MAKAPCSRATSLPWCRIAATTAGPQRPIDDVSKSRRRSGNDHKVASSAIEIIFNSLQFVPRQLLAEPDDSRPHERGALCASWNLLPFLATIPAAKIAA